MTEETSTRQLVKDLLTDIPYARDCDYILYEQYLSKIGIYAQFINVKKWLNWQKHGGYTKSGRFIACINVISRRRRDIQKKYPLLRGTKWYERHEKLQNETLIDLDYKPKTSPDASGMRP